ncbi:MAG: OmpA family protein [Desulfoprunum sp.]|nr:OmpA family protein [Desulfoprunum sp.]
MKKTLCKTAMLITLMGSLAFIATSCSKKAVIPPDSMAGGSGGNASGASGYDENNIAAEGTLDDAASNGLSNAGSDSDEYKKMHGRCSENLFPIYFDFDQAGVRSDMTEVLVKNGEQMQKTPGAAIVIEGNSDERGTNEYNLALGERRALAAKQYLVDLGIDAARIQTISYGEERPLFTGQDEDSFGNNRRDDFIMK